MILICKIQYSFDNNSGSLEILSINNSLCTQESKKELNVTNNTAFQDMLKNLTSISKFSKSHCWHV